MEEYGNDEEAYKMNYEGIVIHKHEIKGRKYTYGFNFEGCYWRRDPKNIQISEEFKKTFPFDLGNEEARRKFIKLIKTQLDNSFNDFILKCHKNERVHQMYKTFNESVKHLLIDEYRIQGIMEEVQTAQKNSELARRELVESICQEMVEEINSIEENPFKGDLVSEFVNVADDEFEEGEQQSDDETVEVEKENVSRKRKKRLRPSIPTSEDVPEDVSEMRKVVDTFAQVFYNNNFNDEPIENMLSGFQETESRSRFLRLFFSLLCSNLNLSSRDVDCISHYIKILLRFVGSEMKFVGCYKTMKKDLEEIKEYLDERISLLLDNCVCFHVSYDSTTLQQSEYHCLHFRTYNDGKVYSFPLKVYILRATGTEAIAESILEEISEHADITKCIGITTDGCSKLIGNKKGVNKLIKKEVMEVKDKQSSQLVNQIFQPIWCNTHRFSLACESLKDVEEIDCMIDVVERLGSSTNLKQYYKFLESNGMKVNKLDTFGATRWLSRGNIMDKMIINLQSISLFFKQTNFTFKSNEGIFEGTTDLQNDSKLHHLFLLVCGIFQRLNSINKHLQKNGLKIYDVYMFMKGFVEWLGKVIENGDLSPFYPKVNKVVVNIENVEEEVKAHVIEALTALKAELERRYITSAFCIRKGSTEKQTKRQSMIDDLINIFYFPNDVLNGEATQNYKVRQISQRMNASIQKELKALRTVIGNNQSKCQDKINVKHIPRIYKHYGLCKSYTLKDAFEDNLINKKYYPQMYSILAIMETIQPTTVSIESLFSQLKHIQNPQKKEESVQTQVRLGSRSLSNIITSITDVIDSSSESEPPGESHKERSGTL